MEKKFIVYDKISLLTFNLTLTYFVAKLQNLKMKIKCIEICQLKKKSFFFTIYIFVIILNFSKLSPSLIREIQIHTLMKIMLNAEIRFKVTILILFREMKIISILLKTNIKSNTVMFWLFWFLMFKAFKLK